MTKESRIARKFERFLFNGRLESDVRKDSPRRENEINTENLEAIGHYVYNASNNTELFIRYLDSEKFGYDPDTAQSIGDRVKYKQD